MVIKNIDGFHGTDERVGQQIAEQGFKIKKYNLNTTNPQDIPGDLGAGLYTYIATNAEENAKKFVSKQGVRNVVVFKLLLEYDEDKLLDMDKESNQQYIANLMNSSTFTGIFRRFKSDKGDKARECLDGYLIEKIISKLRSTTGIDIDVVKKKTYTPFLGHPKLSHIPNGVELCVRNKNVIKKIEKR